MCISEPQEVVPVPWKPNYPGEYPTLGWYVLDWISDNLARPDSVDYEPLILTPEQAQFVLQYYRLDPRTGRRVVRRGVWSRPKGHGKSPLVGGIGIVEALADVVPDGWDANGQPVGRPWSSVRTPLIQFAAVNEDQTRNAFDPLLEMIRQGPVLDNYDIDPMDSFVALPKGRIEYVTAAALSKEGNRPVFASLDQTESWYRTNGGIKLADTLRRNLLKVGGSSIETPNAYRPGEGSVSEATASYHQQIVEGKVRTAPGRLLWDHREAPADTDMSDDQSLYEGLLHAYGDSAIEAGGWVDIREIMDGIRDPNADPQDSRQYFLNQITHASDSWVSQPEIRAIVDTEKVLAPGDRIVLGFDGSRGRTKGNPDATALVGIRVSDGFLFSVNIWEKGPNDVQEWAPPLLEIEATLAHIFDTYRVAGFYADPSGWQSQVASWEARYHRKLRLKASRSEPIAAWPRGKGTQVAEDVERLRQAIRTREISMSESPALIRHLLNARRRTTRNGYLLYKAYPDSPDKIDAAYAAVLAYRAYLDALAAGVGKSKSRTKRKIGVL